MHLAEMPEGRVEFAVVARDLGETAKSGEAHARFYGSVGEPRDALRRRPDGAELIENVCFTETAGDRHIYPE